jgi:hypothetical protein
MFPDSAIASKFSMGHDKCRYIIIYGLAPYFHQELISELHSPRVEFSVSFDESLNKSVQLGQMDLHVRLWDVNNNKAVTRYFNSQFLGKASATDLLHSFKSGLGCIDKHKVIQVSMDGPNVNWAFYKLLKEEVSPDSPLLLDTGSCGLHIAHGAFHHGHDATSWNVNGVLSAIWRLFKDSPAKRAAYQVKF